MEWIDYRAHETTCKKCTWHGTALECNQKPAPPDTKQEGNVEVARYSCPKCGTELFSEQLTPGKVVPNLFKFIDAL